MEWRLSFWREITHSKDKSSHLAKGQADRHSPWGSFFQNIKQYEPTTHHPASSAQNFFIRATKLGGKYESHGQIKSIISTFWNAAKH